MKHICLVSGISYNFAAIFISSIDSPARWLTLDLMHAKTQGKRQWKKQQQALGRNLELDSLQSDGRLEYAESATMISHSLLMSKLTAPILLPQPTTIYPFSFKKTAATSTSLHSCCPKVMNPSQFLSPQPLKSKQAKATPSGSEDRNNVPQNLLDPFPCKYSKTYLVSCWEQSVNSKGI